MSEFLRDIHLMVITASIEDKRSCRFKRNIFPFWSCVQIKVKIELI